MTVYIPIGISGSGKSSYQKENLPKVKVICPDDIRKKFTGSCSDQSMNDEVFEEAYNELTDCACENKDVYFSSTNLSIKAVQRIYDCALQNASKKSNLRFMILLFTASKNEDLCRSRVKTDLENGVDRSNTLTLVDDLEGHQLDYDYVHKQHEEYLEVEKEIFNWRSKVFEETEDDIPVKIVEVSEN